MKVIPVIDLMGGQVVRGVAGRRGEYLPIQSRICPDSRPEAVAATFAEEGFEVAYLADLDAILGGTPNWTTYEAIIRSGLRLWIDPGLRDRDDACAWADFTAEWPDVEGVIAGLESLTSIDSLGDLREMLGERLVFSLDLNQGKPLSRESRITGLRPLEIAKIAINSGVRRLIVLDLASVGIGEGPRHLPLIRDILSTWPDVTLVTGGGVRDATDLAALVQAGCHGALVASSLHDGSLRPGDLRRWSGDSARPSP
jgi:HisA/HisF family protein